MLESQDLPEIDQSDPGITSFPCVRCGLTYPGLTLRAARDAHEAAIDPDAELDRTNHPYSPGTQAQFIVVTANTLREQEHPSGEVDDRDSGNNDHYSNP